MNDFLPTREKALGRLYAFTPSMGSRYAQERNEDVLNERGGRDNVSMLSPYVRHRLLLESELVTAALDRFAFGTAEKFIQEVCWRTYWKGWLERRPVIWKRYQERLSTLSGMMQEDRDSPMQARWEAACAGQTNILCFDTWARELVDTGYLHNHTRMWFASIWIFTLHLPWELGADFFLRHLLDGDPASNTLSWRWVAGLQTRGKHYLARAENIARYTHGRFDPRGVLNEHAAPLAAEEIPGSRALANLPEPDHTAISALLLHEDDLYPESLITEAGLESFSPVVIAALRSSGKLSPHPVSGLVQDFTQGALDDGLKRAATHFHAAVSLGFFEEQDAAMRQFVQQLAARSVAQVLTPYAPVGNAADGLGKLEVYLSLLGIRLIRYRRAWDETFWPHSDRGFFVLREKIPDCLRKLGLA